MTESYDFLMSLESWSRPYQDPRKALDSIAGQPDRILVKDATRGILSITCNGNGLRRDFAPEIAHGYAEHVRLDSELILTVAAITPTKPVYHRMKNDGSVHFGVQLHGMQEIVPTIHSEDDNLMFVGVVGAGRNERVLRVNDRFLAVDLMLPSLAPEADKILDVDAPSITRIIADSLEELAGRDAYFSHDWAGSALRHCSYEILHCEFQGALRFSYLRAKANELLCLLEARAIRLDEVRPQPSYRLTQSDREILEKVRLHIENSPKEDLSIESLSLVAGFSANRTTALFKAQYNVTPHQYVINARMKKAKELLSSTDLPIKDICKAVGYRDLSGFGRAFKKTYGVQPTAIRRH